MTNVERGVYKLEIGDKERLFKLDLNALVSLESIGVNLQDLKDDNGKDQLTAMRGILWAGFRTFEHDLNIMEVGSWIDFDNMEVITDFLSTVFTKMSEKK